MRLHVSLIFVALFAHAHARAATINGPAALDLEKKLPVIPEPSEDANKDVAPSENVSSEQELIDSANTVKDIENNLRVKAIDSIPVSVIVDGDVSNPVENEVTPDVKRVELDLKNPGEPQRQEHETQNAVHYDDAEQQMVTTVKQTVADTQNALKQGFQGITSGIQNWIANNEQLSAIQASLNNVQENFYNQLSKINETVHSFWNNRIQSQNPTAVDTTVVTDPQPQIETVESQLKILENNFQTGVKALSEGVQVFATLKAENENPSSPAPTVPNNLFVQYLQLFQNTLTQGFNNVTHALQNYVSQNAANNNSSSGGLLQSWNNGLQNILNPSTTQGSTQGDAEGSTLRPTIWQGIQSSIQNILSPGQAQSQTVPGSQSTNGASTPNRPIAQAIQNLPFVQGVVSLINRPAAQPVQPAAQPEKPADPAAVPSEPGSNVVPVPEKKPETEVKEPAKEPEKPEAQAAVPEQATSSNGPIKNIIQNNPIVQGISSAVQRLQASINNPEKPREEEKVPVKEQSIPIKEENIPVQENVPVKGESSDKIDTKWGFGLGHLGYGGGHSPGDNNNSGGKLIPENLKVEEPKLPVEIEKTDKS